MSSEKDTPNKPLIDSGDANEIKQQPSENLLPTEDVIPKPSVMAAAPPAEPITAAKQNQPTEDAIPKPTVATAAAPPAEPMTAPLPAPNYAKLFGLIESLASTAKLDLSGPPKPPGPPQVRRTSDLMDRLHTALIAQPLSQPRPMKPLCVVNAQYTVVPNTHFAVSVDVRCASNVTKTCGRVHKKCHGSSSSACSSDALNGAQEHEDSSTYVTFEALGPSKCMVNSPDGPVYTTRVEEHSSRPTWNTRFNVALPIEYLTRKHKRFVLKLWRKSVEDGPETRTIPTPFQDIMMGYITLNLTQLLDKSIYEWFNVMDENGRINARMQVKVTTKADLDPYRPKPIVASSDDDEDALLTQQLDEVAEQNSLLNITLKRKFTELEDITKRLKARLIDVTDETGFSDIEDDFEIELNTLPNEEDDSDDGLYWLEEAGIAPLRVPYSGKVTDKFVVLGDEIDVEAEEEEEEDAATAESPQGEPRSEDSSTANSSTAA